MKNSRLVDQLINMIENKCISDEDKKKKISALYTIRKIFSDEWLENASKENHPLTKYLTQFLFDSQVIELGEQLLELEAIPNFSNAIKDLKTDAGKFNSILAELDFAFRLKKAGWKNIRFIKPGKENHDITAELDGKSVHFEVTQRRSILEGHDETKLNPLGYKASNQEQSSESKLILFCEDEAKKIINKINEEIEQLPKNKPGIIALYAENLILFSHLTSFLRALAAELKKTFNEDPVNKYPQLSAIIVKTSFINGIKNCVIEEEGFIVIQKTNESGETDVLLIVKNENSDFDLPARVLSSLKNLVGV